MSIQDCKTGTMNFDKLVNSETAYGEPQWWMDGLDRDRTLEVTHEEYGLPDNEQFFSCRVHCSDVEYDNGDYSSTYGVIDTMCMDAFDYDEIIRWADAVAKLD